MRLRSDEQLVALFRAGSNEAFRVIHDRYRRRLLAYIRQMLAGCPQEAEDVLQEVFERAYSGLRSNRRELALRAWLYRVAHNRCVDELRRPAPVMISEPDDREGHRFDPIAVSEQRETLRRLVKDVQGLPEQQRSALLLREMSGMSYADLSAALGVTVPAVKSLLVRARFGLAAAVEARDTTCTEIREELVLCHERGGRPTGRARRHLRECEPCRHFRHSVRGTSKSLTALAPVVGPLGLLVKLLGGGTGALGSGGTAAGGGAAASVGGAAAGVTTAASAGGSVGLATGVSAGGFAATAMGHVATVVAAAIVTAGGAVAAQSAGSAVLAEHPVATPHGVVTHPAPVHSNAPTIIGGQAVLQAPEPTAAAAPVPARSVRVRSKRQLSSRARLGQPIANGRKSGEQRGGKPARRTPDARVNTSPSATGSTPTTPGAGGSTDSSSPGSDSTTSSSSTSPPSSAGTTGTDPSTGTGSSTGESTSPDPGGSSPSSATPPASTTSGS